MGMKTTNIDNEKISLNPKHYKRTNTKTQRLKPKTQNMQNQNTNRYLLQ
jgi:hypothetical protein